MADTCTKCTKAIFAAEVPIRVPGGVYHPLCFKCKACNTQLTLKTATTKEGHIYCKGHVPTESPDQGIDSKTATQMAAPKQHMGGRNLEEMAAGQGSSYGKDALGVATALSAPKAPTSVNNVNKMEVRHNGVHEHS